MRVLLICLFLFVSSTLSLFSQVHWSRIYDADYGYGNITRTIVNKVSCTGKYLVATGLRTEAKQAGKYIMDTAMTQYFGISRDSGRTWQSVEPPIYSPKTKSYTKIEQIIVLDSLNLMACGGVSTFQKNHLLRSTDGGNSWITFADNINSVVHNPRMSFFNNKKGILAGEYEFTFFRTDDAGNSWSIHPSQHHIDTLIYDYYNHPVWIDSMTVFNFNYNQLRSSQFLFPDVFRTFLSTDAGITWKQLGCTIKGYEGDSSTRAHFLGVFFPTPNKGYAVGRINKAGKWFTTAFTTSDKGISWSISDTLERAYGNDYSTGRTFGQDTFVYMTEAGKIRMTKDGGVTWTFVIDNNIINHLINFDERLRTCYFFSPDKATAFSSIPSTIGGVIINPAIYKLEKGVSAIESPSIDVQIDETRSVYLHNVYPQPAKENVTLQIYAVPQSNGLTLKLYNTYGVEVADFTEQLQQTPSSFGWKSVSLSINVIPTGVYIAHIKGNGISRSVTIMVMK